MNGGAATASWQNKYSWGAAGGSSGGGTINIFAKEIKEYGDITTNGGIAVSSNSKGGAGGTGTVTINELGSVLNYVKKRITLRTDETYKIDKSKISYTKLNDVQTEDLTVGNLTFEAIDKEMIAVDNTGKIIPKKIGTTKVKITDLDNEYSTYIIVDIIIGDTKSQIKQGSNFTVALKENGTVWEYGYGIENKPVQVLINGNEFKDIRDIGAGTANRIALDKNGEVYIWGAYKKNKEENETDSEGNAITKVTEVSEIIKEPTKVEGLENIITIDAYEENFYAVAEDGTAYIWGKGYTKPTKVDTDVKIADVDGNLLLGENGLVYNVSTPKIAIKYLNNVAEVACGTNHNLFATLDGYVKSIGTGDLGQLGSGEIASRNISTFVKTKNGEYLTDIVNISAGNKTSIASDINGKVYVWGDNANKKIGIDEIRTSYATQITKLQDRDGKTLELSKIENVETGVNHSSISDEYGYVYTVRTKYRWTAWNRGYCIKKHIYKNSEKLR